MEQNESEKIEAQKRFEALPENLKKEMLSDKNGQIIISTCQDYKISEEDFKKVSLLAGEVFLGYIKPEQVASELNKYFGVELQKSNFIEIELKQKIFNGLKADLDKIYNPINIEAQQEEEVSPAVIKIGSFGSAQDKSFEQASSVIPNLTRNPEPQNLDSRLRGNDKKTIEPATPVEEAVPFIIQTKIEAVKAAIPQFPKESPSLNLKVDPSIIQKNPIIKPISVHLETTEPVQGKRFQMPVIAGQKIFSSTPQPAPTISHGLPMSTPPRTQKTEENITSEVRRTTIFGTSEVRSSEVNPVQNPPQPSFLKDGVKIPIQPLSAPSLKEISEQKTESPLIERKPFDQAQDKPTMPEPANSAGSGQAKVVHYSAFKTDLNNLGAPKQPKTNEGFINLNTFTKVSGNTVDLRSKPSNN